MQGMRQTSRDSSALSGCRGGPVPEMQRVKQQTERATKQRELQMWQRRRSKRRRRKEWAGGDFKLIARTS